MKKENIETELREAVIENYLVRWAGRFGVPASHGIDFKLIDQKKHGNSVVYSYEISLVKHSGMAQLSVNDFIWEGHLDKNDAEKIFSHLLENEIIIRRRRAFYFNLSHIRITREQLRSLLLELAESGLVSRVVPKFAFKPAKKFIHAKTITYILRLLRGSIVKVDSTTLKITHLGGSRFSKSHVFRLLETAGSYNVVKVDTTPVSWEQYSNDLRNQRTVAARLAAEIKILVPGLTFALSGVKYLWANRRYQFLLNYQGDLSLYEQDQLFGDKLLQQADHDEKLRDFLKIRDRYGYFMPYLEEGILLDIIDEIHGYKEMPGSSELRIDNDAARERAADFHLLAAGDFSGFKRKYPEADPELLDIVGSLSARKKYDSPEEFFAVLRQTELKESRITAGEAYEKNVSLFLRDSYLASSGARKELAHICAGLLKLFVILRRKNIAIRDLKAGNIFLTGKGIMDGGLGLLDFETAIIYATPFDSSKIPQPRLGGTPSRGTPSLWFANDVLQSYYGELQRPLYLPDLYAITEIIYSAVTREPLFKKGKEIIQNIFEIINGNLELEDFKMNLAQPAGEGEETTYVLETTIMNRDNEATRLDESGPQDEGMADMLEVYGTVNNIYWESVFAEFQENISRHKYLLEQIEISAPTEFAQVLKEEIKLNCTLLETQLEQSGNLQKIRQRELDRHHLLLNAPLKKITAYKLLQLLFITVALYMNRIS